jgi:hypothetical protein
MELQAPDSLPVGGRRYGHRMSNAAPWASTAGNKFREVARTTENQTTKLLAEGLTALTEALRELDDRLEKVDQRLRQA